MTTMTVSQARAALPDVLDRVLAGDEVTITRHGRPVAVVVSPQLLRVRRADDAFAAADQLRTLLDDERGAALTRGGGLSSDRADELVAEVRADRDVR